MDTEMQYECNPPCLTGKGTCIPPGFCACEKGWMGDVCDDGMYMYTWVSLITLFYMIWPNIDR